LFFVRKSSRRLKGTIKSKPNCIPSPRYVYLNHCLFECAIDFEQEIGCAVVITERQFILSSLFETPNNETSSCWKICVGCGAQVITRIRASCRRASTASATLLGQLSIKNMDSSPANSPRVRSSLGLGRQTIQMYSGKVSASRYRFARDFKMKSLPTHRPGFFSCPRTEGVIMDPKVFPSVSVCDCCVFHCPNFNPGQDLAFGIVSERQMTSWCFMRL
jgi:hypothetical protein